MAIASLRDNAGEANALCNDERLPIAAEKRVHCRAQIVPYRSSDFSGTALLAQIPWGVRMRGDYGVRFYHYFLEVPEEEIVFLGEFPQWRNTSPLIHHWKTRDGQPET